MKEVFEQYGGAIITVIAILALAAIATVLLTNQSSGIVYKAFSDLITNFYSGIK
ncbi:MAG: hypothetical protein RR364_03370 [Lachnospiraceae bacterium]